MVIRVVHCKKETNHEQIGRPSPLGNPYPLPKGALKGSTLPKYKKWINQQIDIRNEKVINELNRLYLIAKNGDLNLGCWCAPNTCHGDIIKELLESKLV